MLTKRLIGRAIKDLKKRRPAIAKRIKVIYSSRTERSLVTVQIHEFLKSVKAEQGVILFVTHSAFLRMRHWHRQDHWHVIIDEIIEVTYDEKFSYTKIATNSSSFCTSTAVTTNTLYRRGVIQMIREIARNGKRDKITAIFQDLAAKLDDRRPWQLLVDTAHYERFCKGELSELELHGLLHSSVFRGFASVTFMAANLSLSLMFRHFVNLGCEFRDHRRIISRLRYTRHAVMASGCWSCT